MSKEAQLLFFKTAFLGIMALVFLALGLASWFKNLSGMFFYYKGGGIYSVRRGRFIMKDTPRNRKLLSRAFAAVWLAGAGVALVALLLQW